MMKSEKKLKTAADLKTERKRLQAELTERGKEIKGVVTDVSHQLNPLAGISSLFGSDKATTPTNAIISSGVNLLFKKVIKNKLGFIPSLITPIVSKTASNQVMKIDAKAHIINLLDWVIEKTETKDKSSSTNIKKTL